MGLFKMQLIAHLGADCQVNSVNGKSVVNFNVCHTEKYKDAQGVEINKQNWVNCSLWLERTTIAPYLKKGVQVYLEGFPTVDTYQNKEGKIIPQQRLRVTSITLLGGQKNENTQPQQQQPQTQKQSTSQNNFNQLVGENSTDLGNDIPF
jgi:single-strand DNA-binding protein